MLTEVHSFDLGYNETFYYKIKRIRSNEFPKVINLRKVPFLNGTLPYVDPFVVTMEMCPYMVFR